ncbi:MAG: sugar phosphate isomerase/epimerase family protein [Acidobacteriota bacterium]
MSPALTRRDFLATSATAAAALALPAWASAAQTTPTKMFISLNGSVSPRVGPWPDAARLAARLGYGGIDWGFAPVKAAGVDATKALFAELKIRPTIVNLPVQQPFAGDDAAFKEKLGPLADDAALAAAIGCERMMLVLSATAPLPKDEYRKIVRDRLAAIGEVLQKSNIRLGLEFLGPAYMHSPNPPPPANPPPAPPTAAAASPAAPGAPTAVPGPGAPQGANAGGRQGGRGPAGPRIPFIWTLPETVALARDSAPNVGAVLDIWHWHHSGGTIADILATDKARIVHVHLSDAKAMAPDDVRDNMRVMPGEGIIDIVGFFQALQKIGYAGGVSPEPLGRIPMDMSTEDAARLGYDTAFAVMKKAGVI